MIHEIRATVWNENVHERHDATVRAIYAEGIHEAIASGIRDRSAGAVAVRTATLEQPEHGLPESVLAETDVLVWWAHTAHDDVSDAVVERVCASVLGGMGLIVLHSGHYAKVFRRLMGTTCSLRWRDSDDREIVWNVRPDHLITQGVPESFTIPKHEMYGEYFDIPQPDELIFISSFSGGEVFRSGCCFQRGRGRIFYFSPGHETFPVYHQPDVQTVITNAVRWAAPYRGSMRQPFDNRNAQSVANE